MRRRFVAKTRAQLDAWPSQPLDGLDLVWLVLGGVHVGEHGLIVALGIAADGQKHALGLWEGATEKATLCQSLLAKLQSRGLRTDCSLLVIREGSKALRKAVRDLFGAVALVQRCQVHKLRNVLDHVPERQRTWAKAILHRASRRADVGTARRLLTDLARRLATDHPSAAESVREGLDETLTVLGLNLPRHPPAVADDHHRGRESDQPYSTRETDREALARWADGGTLGRRRRTRSGQRLPSIEGAQGDAAARRGTPCSRSAARTRCGCGERRVVVNRAAAEFQQPAGHRRLDGVSAGFWGLQRASGGTGVEPVTCAVDACVRVARAANGSTGELAITYVAEGASMQPGVDAGATTGAGTIAWSA